MSREAVTGPELTRLLERLDPDPLQAAVRYEDIRRRLIRLFEWRGCNDAEDLTDETFDRVAKRLAEGMTIEADDPYRYLCGVAHHVFQEMVRRRTRERVAAEELPRVVTVAALNRSEREPHLRCLDGCLEPLPPGTRDLLLDYYEGQGRPRIDRRAMLAQRRGLSQGALRVHVHRLREQLERCVKACIGGGRNRSTPPATPS